MTALAPLPQTVPPLVARLGSDSDGERLACLRQLDRVLDRAGVTWTDLARRIEEPIPKPQTTHAEPDPTDWRAAINWIVAHPEWRPSAREEKFVFDMARLVTQRHPTAKQAAWLRGIVARLEGAHV